jgi:hypothetical protein
MKGESRRRSRQRGRRGMRAASGRRRSLGLRPDRPAATGDSQQRWVSQRPRLSSHCVLVCAGSRSTRSLS